MVEDMGMKRKTQEMIFKILAGIACLALIGVIIAFSYIMYEREQILTKGAKDRAFGNCVIACLSFKKDKDQDYFMMHRNDLLAECSKECGHDLNKR